MKLKQRKMPASKDTNLFICGLIGGGIGLALAFLMVLIAPLAIINTENPNSLVTPVAATCIGIGGLAGGIISAMQSSSSKLLAGMISAAVILVPISVVSFISPLEFEIKNAVVSVIAVAICAFLGAFVVDKIDSANKHSMKKVMKRR